MTLSKTCTTCGCFKSHDQFPKHRTVCKVCYNERERLRKYETRYGLKGDEADKLKAEGCCEICGNEEGLVIDHNHATEEFRGVLCDSCNKGIGILGDSPLLLNKAATYLLEKGHYGETNG